MRLFTPILSQRAASLHLKGGTAMLKRFIMTHAQGWIIHLMHLKR